MTGVDDLVGHDQVMLGVDGGLDIVADDTTAATAGRHGPSIRVGQRDLLVFALHHLGVQLVQALYLLAQRHDLLVEPRDLGFRNRVPLAIRTIKLREVAGQRPRRICTRAARSIVPREVLGPAC